MCIQYIGRGSHEPPVMPLLEIPSGTRTQIQMKFKNFVTLYNYLTQQQTLGLTSTLLLPKLTPLEIPITLQETA